MEGFHGGLITLNDSDPVWAAGSADALVVNTNKWPVSPKTGHWWEFFQDGEKNGIFSVLRPEFAKISRKISNDCPVWDWGWHNNGCRVDNILSTEKSLSLKSCKIHPSRNIFLAGAL